MRIPEAIEAIFICGSRPEPTVALREDRVAVGVIALTGLFTTRTRILDAGRRRERVLRAGLRLPALFGGGSDSAA